MGLSRRCTDTIPGMYLRSQTGLEREGAVLSLNVALRLALVPSDALSIHLRGEPLHSQTQSRNPVSFPHK